MMDLVQNTVECRPGQVCHLKLPVLRLETAPTDYLAEKPLLRMSSLTFLHQAPLMAAFVLHALSPCLTSLSPSMADGKQVGNLCTAFATENLSSSVGNIGAALATKTWPAFAPKMDAALAAPFAPKLWPAFAPKMGAAFAAPFAPKLWPAFAPKMGAASAAPFAPKSHVPSPSLAQKMLPACAPKMWVALPETSAALTPNTCTNIAASVFGSRSLMPRNTPPLKLLPLWGTLWCESIAGCGKPSQARQTFLGGSAIYPLARV